MGQLHSVHNSTDSGRAKSRVLYVDRKTYYYDYYDYCVPPGEPNSRGSRISPRFLSQPIAAFAQTRHVPSFLARLNSARVYTLYHNNRIHYLW